MKLYKLLLAVSAIQTAVATSFATGNASNSTAAPCAQVSSLIYSAPTASSTVPAQIAYDCIKSVPLNGTAAKILLKEIRPYVEWQSTLAYLADPPAEYAAQVQPAVNIVAGLDTIAANVDAGKYDGEYDFGWSLYSLIQSAHDGHFTFVPDSVGTIFNFFRTTPLVSVSEDGRKLPSIFAYQDVLGLQYKNISYVPSRITKINGQVAETYLENWSQYGSLQDRDALYNNVFYELAQISLGSDGTATGTFTGQGRGRWVYPGPATTFTFANGTTSTIQNFARALVPFRGIESGQDLSDQYFYFTNPGTTEEPDELNDQAAAQAATAPGYPTPTVPGPLNLINGYYINTPGYEQVAVLSVPNFVGIGSAEISFQQTTQKLISRAVADGKTKLIIDVQANGGGTILQGYDMFKQFFPALLPYGATRFRATEAADLIGQAFSAFAKQFPRSPTANATMQDIESSYFDYQEDADINYRPFPSWIAKFGPVQNHGDKFTNIARWNLSDVFIAYNSGGINITGYGTLSNVTRQPFKPENIVILTDGYCASTCTIFSELMRQQGGVKTIALGGRANRKAIQAIGGVKGANNFAYSFVQSLAQEAVIIKPSLKNGTLGQYYSDTPFNRAAVSPGVNVRDALRQNDTSGTPLQFIYEEADCRLYYTPEMTIDATAIWKAAADAQWGGKGNCINSGGYGKREDEDVTTTLSAKRILARTPAARLQAYEAFERTFHLRTNGRMQGDGFMAP